MITDLEEGNSGQRKQKTLKVQTRRPEWPEQSEKGNGRKKTEAGS